MYLLTDSYLAVNVILWLHLYLDTHVSRSLQITVNIEVELMPFEHSAGC